MFNDSINAFKGHPGLVDYTATKGSILGFARSLNAQLTGKTGIRVNCTSELLTCEHTSLVSRVSPFRCCPRSDLDSVDVCSQSHLNPLPYTHPCANRSPPSMTKESKEQFGLSTTIGHAGQPIEVATCFVFLASADSSYIRCVHYHLDPISSLSFCLLSGQTLHPNGGVVVGS